MGTMRVECNGPRLRIQWTWPGLEPETVSLGYSSLPIRPMHLPTNNGWNQIFINIGNWSRKIMNIMYLIFPWGGNSHIKRMGAHHQFWKESQIGIKILFFLGMAWNIFLLFLRDSSSHTTHLSPTTFLWLNFTLKGSAKAPIVCHSILNTPRGTKITFNPKTYEKDRHSFYMRVNLPSWTLFLWEVWWPHG